MLLIKLPWFVLLLLLLRMPAVEAIPCCAIVFRSCEICQRRCSSATCAALIASSTWLVVGDEDPCWCWACS
jgi:hypothetical protein